MKINGIGINRLASGALCLSLAIGGMSLLVSQASAFFAHNFPCDWKAGFVPDPAKKQRIGYLTDFNGLGLTAPLAKDLAVHVAYNSPTHPAYTPMVITGGQSHVVGVIEHLSWNGGVGDPFTFSVYMSQENANKLKALKQTALKTTSITSLGFWIGNYDQEKKEWYEEAYPLVSGGKFVGQLNAPSRTDVRLHIADDGARVSPGSSEMVYNVYFEVAPAANQTATFHIATSPTMKVAKSWGLVVGTHPGRE